MEKNTFTIFKKITSMNTTLKGFIEITNLFRVFIELYKQKCLNSTFEFNLFFEKILGINTNLYVDGGLLKINKLFKIVASNADAYLSEEFIDLFGKLTNEQYSSLFVNYYSNSDTNNENIKHNTKIEDLLNKAYRKKVVLQFTFDQDLKMGDYFAVVKVGYCNDYLYTDDKPDNYDVLTEICFGYDEKEYHRFISNISNILSRKVYYSQEEYIASLYVDLEYTFRDLFNFVQYLLYIDSIIHI